MSRRLSSCSSTIMLLIFTMTGCERHADILPWPYSGPGPAQTLDQTHPVSIIYVSEGLRPLDDATYAAIISYAVQHGPQGRRPWFLWVARTAQTGDGTQTSMVRMYYTPEVAAPRLRRGRFLTLGTTGTVVASDNDLSEYNQVPPPGESFADDAPPTSSLEWPFVVHGSFTDGEVVEAADLTRTIMAGGKTFAGKPIKVALPSGSWPEAFGPRDAFAPLPIDRIVRQENGNPEIWTGTYRGQHFEYLKRGEMYVIRKSGPWVS